MPSSVVLSQIESWLTSTSRPRPAILRGRTVAGLHKRVQLALSGASVAEESAWLARLHRLATVRREPKGEAAVDFTPVEQSRTHKRPSGAISSGVHSSARRPRAAARQLDPVPEAEEVTSISRVSGRPRKAPRKFKEVVEEPGRRLGRANVGAKAPNGSKGRTGPRSASSPGSGAGRHLSNKFDARGDSSRSRGGGSRTASDADLPGIGVSFDPVALSSSKRFSAVSPRKNLAASPRGGAGVSESRIGSAYQAKVSSEVAVGEPSERADQLVWSPELNPLGAGELDHFVASAQQFVGGPVTQPLSTKRLQAAALETFPEERAYHALHRSDYSAESALRRLQSERADRALAWTNVELRHLRSGMAKYKKDLHMVHEVVKTKDFKSVLRFYYLENGLAKKLRRDKEREIEELRNARTSTPSANATPPQGEKLTEPVAKESPLDKYRDTLEVMPMSLEGDLMAIDESLGDL